MFAIAYSADDTKESIQAAQKTLQVRFQKIERQEAERFSDEIVGVKERHQQKIAVALAALTEEERTEFNKLKMQYDIYYRMWWNHELSKPVLMSGLKNRYEAWLQPRQALHNDHVKATMKFRAFLYCFPKLYDLFF